MLIRKFWWCKRGKAALKNVHDAIGLCLEARAEQGLPLTICGAVAKLTPKRQLQSVGQTIGCCRGSDSDASFWQLGPILKCLTGEF